MTTATASGVDSAAETVRRGRPHRAAKGAGRPGLAWAAPAAVFFGLFALVPLLLVVVLSFTRWNGLGSPEFSGLENWSRLLDDPVMVKSLWLSLLLTVLGVVVQTPISLLLGVWAAGHQRNRAVLSAIYFVPLLLSVTAVSVLWRAVLDPNFGIPSRAAWLFGDGNLFGTQAGALGVLVLVSTWQFTPLHTLLYQGAARAVPDVLYQAARIDGAGAVRQFFHVTLPQLRNTIVTSTILMVVGRVFRVFLLGLAIPSQAVIVPMFYLINEAGLYDNLLGVILPTAAFAMPVCALILTGVMRDITPELYEAMTVDGASPRRIFVRLVLPLSKSGLSTIVVFSSLQAWNGFLFPLVLTQSSENKVITMGLYDFQTEHGVDIPGLLAAVVLSMLPVLLVYLFARRALVQGLMGVGGK